MATFNGKIRILMLRGEKGDTGNIEVGGILPVANGGTGSATAIQAQSNLGLMKRYTSLDHLNLPENYEIADVFSSMANNTYIELDISTINTALFPQTQGVAKFFRISANRAYAEYKCTYNIGRGSWVGYYHSIPGFSGWKKIYTDNDTVPIENGGTGAKTAADALTNLGVIDLIYPVGSIYMSVNDVNPSTLFGGTWVRWGAGRVPIGVNTSDSDFSTVEKTGGEKSHTLTVNEMPSHNHRSEKTIDWGEAFVGSDHDIAFEPSDSVQIRMEHRQVTDGVGMVVNYNSYTDSTGNNAAHNNLPPYITCYMWKRTA